MTDPKGDARTINVVFDEAEKVLDNSKARKSSHLTLLSSASLKEFFLYSLVDLRTRCNEGCTSID